MSTTPDKMFTTLHNMDAKRPLTFPERVEYILKEEGMRKADLARALGIERGTVTEWISGRTQGPRADIPFLVEDRLGYAARWFATGEGPIKAKKLNPDDSVILESIQSLTDPGKKQEARNFIDFLNR